MYTQIPNFVNGEFTIQIKDAETLKIREEIVANNVITNRFLLESFPYKESNFTGFAVPFLTSLNISFSQENIPNGLKSVTGFGKFIATANTDAVNVGPKVTYVDSNSDGLFDTIEIRQRLMFVGSIYASNVAYSRTFRTVALTSLSPAIDHTISNNLPTYPNNTAVGGVWAYVNLGSNFTQNANEIIDVTYRLKISSLISGYKASRSILHDFIYTVDKNSGNVGWQSDAGSTVKALSNHFAYCRFPESGWSYFNMYLGGNISDTKFSPDQGETLSGKDGAARFDVVSAVSSSNLDYTLGSYYAGIGLGINTVSTQNKTGRGVLYNPFNTINYSSVNTPFQDLFSHGPGAFAPFQDNANLAGGSGKLTLGGTWSDDFPYMYRFEILTTGALGVATYAWQRRRVSRFLGNTFNFQALATPFTHYNSTNPLANKPFPTYHAGQGVRTHDLGYSSTQIVRYNPTGITLLNLVNGNYQSWDATTTPALPVTNLWHVDLDKTANKIYAACRDTGLWEITPGGAVNRLVTTPCRSVSVGFGGVVYALFWDGSTFTLRNSSDWATNIPQFSFPLSNLNGSDNQFLWFIIAGRSAANQVGIMTSHKNGGTKVWWWSLAGLVVGPTHENAAGLNSENYLTFFESSPKCLVSSKTGKWYTALRVISAYDNSGHVYTFGSTGFSPITGSYDQTRIISHSPLLDDDGYLYAAKWLMDGNVILVNLAGGYQDSSNTLYCSACVLDKNLLFVSRYDGGGDFIYNWSSGNRITSGLTNSAINTTSDQLHPATWERFTWDGTDWVSADPTWNGTAWIYPAITGKPTHTTTDTLIDGLTINFSELSNLGFKAGDWYSQVVSLGVLKSNVNNLQLSSSVYIMPTELVTTSETHTIGASAPYAVTISKSSRGGSSPDNTFRWLDPDVVPMEVQIAGYGTPATVRTSIEITPSLNEVLVNSSNGSIICNPADAGKSLTINKYLFTKGDEIRSIATSTPFAGIHNPVILLRHDTGVTNDGSGGVTGWNDQSGYGNNTVAPSGHLPTLDQSLLVKGVPSIKFDTNYRRLILPEHNPVNFSQGFTFVARVYRINGNRDRQVIFEMRNEGTAANSHVIFGFNYSSFSVYHAPFTGSTNEQSAPDNNYNSWKTYLATYNPNTSRLLLRINGQTITSTTLLGNIGRFFGAARPQVIGSNASTNNNWSLTGNMSFFAAYNHYLTTKECEVLEQAVVNIT